MVDDIWVGWWKLGSTCLLLGGVSRVNTHIHMCTIEKGEIEQAEENTKKEDQNLRGQGDHDTKCINMCRLLQPGPSSTLVNNFLAQ